MAPAAGGGPQGGHGADVANVDLQGTSTSPSQITCRTSSASWRCDSTPVSGALRAEVVFLIHKDGSVTGFRFQTRSNVYSFDTEVQGAVEGCHIGPEPLAHSPRHFPMMCLPVIFNLRPAYHPVMKQIARIVMLVACAGLRPCSRRIPHVAFTSGLPTILVPVPPLLSCP